MKYILFITVIAFCFIGCKNTNTDDSKPIPFLIFNFKFDPTQARLGNTGNISTVAVGNAAQTPTMNKLSAHYIELSPSATTALGAGAVLYKADETTTGGATAIDFSKSFLGGNGSTFYAIPLSSIATGSYPYLRVSLAYQNVDVKMHLDTIINTATVPLTISEDFPTTIAGFIGFNTYINSFLVKNQTVTVNANKLQGYWAAETSGSVAGFNFSNLSTGQSPANGTTVVNPLFASSPIPAGSCVVTAAFAGGTPLKITGAETKDIVVTVSLSTNNSFEWKEIINNGKWDATKGEKVVDMGLRGMIPSFQ